jgi:hypothetical protein
VGRHRAHISTIADKHPKRPRTVSAETLIRAVEVYRDWAQAVNFNGGSSANDVKVEGLIRSLFGVFRGRNIEIKPKVGTKELLEIIL